MEKSECDPLELFLLKNGLGDYQRTFQDNHIRFQDLRKLSESDIDKLIPIIVHQIIFRNSLQSLEEEDLQTNVIVNEITANEECIAKCSSDKQEKHQLENYREVTSYNSDLSLPHNVIIDVPPVSPSSRSESSVLALSTSSFTNIVQNLELESLLQSTLLGRAVIQSYRSSELLDTKCQSLLVEIIITHLLNNNQQRLLNEDFNDLADKIITLFPNEVKGVYYIPPLRKRHSSENISGISKGKLVDKYRNTLTLLRKCGVIKSSRKGEIQNQSSDDSDEGEKVNENENESFVWLKNRTEPWTEVEKHWERSFDFRNRMFKDKKVTIHDIYKEWPILSQNAGYLLVNKDFEKLFPMKTLYGKWDKVYDKLIQYRENFLTGTDAIIKNFIKSGTLDREYRHYLQLCLLAALIPYKGRVSAKKSKGMVPFKPSASESKNSILAEVNIPADVSKVVKDKIQEAASIGATLQPFIIVEVNGNAVHNIYVNIYTSLYKVPSILSAVETCFSSFHVFNLKYPIESHHLWLFIQLAMYDLTTKEDKSVPFIIDLVNKTKIK